MTVSDAIATPNTVVSIVDKRTRLARKRLDEPGAVGQRILSGSKILHCLRAHVQLLSSETTLSRSVAYLFWAAARRIFESDSGTASRMKDMKKHGYRELHKICL